MLRQWLWLSLVATATVVMAQTFTVKGSKGSGSAVNEDGQPALFRYEVKQVIHNDTQREALHGAFHFSLLNRQERTQLTIDLLRLTAYRQRIGDTEKVAEFKGPAVMSVVSPQGGRRVRGELTVLVKDNRPTTVREGDPDEIGLRFVAGDPAKPFAFRGKVVRGDIVIFDRHAPR